MPSYLKMQFVLKEESGSLELTEDPNVDGGILLTFGAPSGAISVNKSDAMLLARTISELVMAKFSVPASADKS